MFLPACSLGAQSAVRHDPAMRPHLASGLIVGGLLAGLALTGCSSSVDGSASGDGATTSATAGSTTAAPAGPPKCVAGELTGSLQDGDAGAGQRSATVLVKNTSTKTCTLDGYGGLGLYMNGTLLPTKAERVLSPGPSLVTLTSGESAKVNLQWTVVPTGSEPVNQCQPAPNQLRVIPPDDTKQVDIAWTYGPVCNQGTLNQSAYHK